MLRKIAENLKSTKHPVHEKPATVFAVLYSVCDTTTGQNTIKESTVRAQDSREAWKILKAALQEEFGKERLFGGMQYRKAAIREA